MTDLAYDNMSYGDGARLKLELLINGNPVQPAMGILNGHINEAINKVSLIDLYTVSRTDYQDDELEQEFLNQLITIKLSSFIDGEEFISRYDGVIFEIDKPDSIQLGPYVYLYRFTIRPEFWKMAIANNSKSFPGKSRPDAIKEVLEANDFINNVTFETEYFNPGDHPTLPQILQCETSDMSFIQRLMREAGINYYFTAPEKQENGAKKKDREIVRIVDSSIFFKKVFPNKIEWAPSRGMNNTRHIDSFETSIRSIPSAVESTASFGEGSTRAFGSSETTKGGGGTFRDFSSEGQNDRVARKNAKVLKERFESKRIRYEAKSNHFCIRAGERFTVSSFNFKKDKEIIVTDVKHSFQQTVTAALNEPGASTPSYSNVFGAIAKDVEYRPQKRTTNIDARAESVRNQVLIDLVTKLNTEIKGKLDIDLNLGLNNHLDLEISPSIDIQTEQFNTVNELIQSCSTFGVHLGTVTAPASVSGGEMTCCVQSDHFGFVKAKVAANWLDMGGGISTFPRAGAQVFFILLNGNTSEGVVVGYRSTGDMSAMDPSKTTITNKLQKGSIPIQMQPPSEVVTVETVNPSNFNRLGIRGKDGVAEVAVIDGDDPFVTINSLKDIFTYAQAEHHCYSSQFLQMVNGDKYVDVLGNDYKGITGDNKTSIGGDQELTVMGEQEIFVKDEQETKIGGDHKLKVGINQKIVIGEEKKETIKGVYKLFVEGSQEICIGPKKGPAKDPGNKKETIKGNKKEMVEGKSKSTIKGKNIEATHGIHSTVDFKKTVNVFKDDWITKIKKDELKKVAENFNLEVGKKLNIKSKEEAIMLESKGGKIEIGVKNVEISADKGAKITGKTFFVAEGKDRAILKTASAKISVMKKNIFHYGDLIKMG